MPGSLSDSLTNTTANNYQARFSEITESKSLVSTPVVSGTVFQEDGVSPAANATVQLYAWPSQEELAKLQEGDSLTRTPIGKTVSDKQGRYTLRIDPKVDITNLWSEFGSLDCELVTLTDTGLNSTSFSIVKSDKEEHEAKLTRSTINDTALADSQNGEVFSGMQIDVKTVAKPVQDSVNSKSIIPEELVEVYAAQWVNVGNILIGSYGYTGQFTFTAGASSTIGCGFSFTGTKGSFSASGTISRSSTSTVGFPSYSSPTQKYMDTQFTFALWRLFAGDGTWYYNVRPHQFAGGARTRDTAMPSDTNWKNHYVAGTYFTKDTNSAKTWSNGAKTSGIIGIDLSAKCGYSASAKIKFTFNSAGYLYGENNYAPITDGLVWVKGS